jgi:hypothetical protein
MRRFHVETYFKIPLRPTTGKPAVSQRQYAAQIGIDQSTFTKWIKNYKEGKYNDIPNAKYRKRTREPDYFDVEKKLVEYIDLRNARISRDKLGLSHNYLQKKALDFAKSIYPANSEELNSFKASNGWLANPNSKSNHQRTGFLPCIWPKNEGNTKGEAVKMMILSRADCTNFSSTVRRTGHNSRKCQQQ